MKVGSLVRSRYAVGSIARARIGIVIQMREGAYEDQPLAQVFWPHRRDAGLIDSKDMEVLSEQK